MSGIEFLTNQARKVEGLAYAGFETFRGSPYTSCARETGQNSRDAQSGSGTVRVAYNLHQVPRAQIPFADQLAHAITCCLASPQDDKTKHHLERAKRTIDADMIRVLEIADYNTTGLTGPVTDSKSVFSALVKGDGVTNKPSNTSAGSFGIGKNAAYAVSDLQTVIYSTRYKGAGDQPHFAAQGRLRLISHTDGDKELSAEGYWGNPDFAAIENPDVAPPWVARTATGTSIFSVGFREEAHWKDRLTLSLATNFFLAIDRAQIEFTVDLDSTIINATTLDTVLGDSDLTEVAESVGQSEDLTRARELMRCVRSDLTTHHELPVPGLGKFTLHLLVADGLPREVHILRNGIYITSNFAKFGQPMKRYPGTREFIAILEPAADAAGDSPSQLLKLLENPAHDAFEPERIIDATAQAKARMQIKGLVAKVRDVIRSVAKIEDVSRSQLDELSHLFAEGGTSDASDDPQAEKDPERFRYGEARKKDPTISPATGTGGGSGRKKRRKNRKGPPRIRKGTGQRTDRPQGPMPTIPLRGVRSLTPSGAPAARTVFFTAATTGALDLEIAASGLSEDVPLELTGTSAGVLIEGRIRLQVQASARNEVTVTFSEPFDGPIEVLGTEVRSPAAAQAA